MTLPLLHDIEMYRYLSMNINTPIVQLPRSWYLKVMVSRELGEDLKMTDPCRKCNAINCPEYELMSLKLHK